MTTTAITISTVSGTDRRPWTAEEIAALGLPAAVLARSVGILGDHLDAALHARSYRVLAHRWTDGTPPMVAAGHERVIGMIRQLPGDASAARRAPSGLCLSLDVYAVTAGIDGRPFNLDNVESRHVEELRAAAFAEGNEALADDCTIAISCVGQTEEERMVALRTVVKALNARQGR